MDAEGTELENITSYERSADKVTDARIFQLPYKTRGHCEDPDCVGCNKEPCGSCQNCLNKKEKR